MKSKNILCGLSMAVVLHLGVLAGFAQTNIYLYSGYETNITLNPGTYIITAYGAPGASSPVFDGVYGGLGAEMSAEFNFSTSTNLTLLVGGGGVVNSDGGGQGGGGGSFVVEDSTPLVIAGGGGGQGGSENYPGGNGNGSTNGGSAVNAPHHNSYGAGGTDGGGGGGGYGSSGGGGGGGGGGGFLGNGTNGFGGYNGGGADTDGGSGGSSFETGGGGGGNGVGGPSGGFGGGGGNSGGFGDGYSGGGGGGYTGGGGGNIINDSNSGGGGGGGSIIDSSAIAILAEVSGTNSPDDPPNPEQGYSGNGEIIIIAIPTPVAITTGASLGFTNGVFGFNVTGPSGSNVVIQASADLQTWIPLQTNLLGSGPLYFSDAQSTTNIQRFYRAKLSP